MSLSRPTRPGAASTAPGRAHPHTALTGYWLDGDTAILHATDYAPRALTGPAAWVHAVLLAYLHPPTPDWRDAPWLDAIRDQLSQ